MSFRIAEWSELSKEERMGALALNLGHSIRPPAETQQLYEDTQKAVNNKETPENFFAVFYKGKPVAILFAQVSIEKRIDIPLMVSYDKAASLAFFKATHGLTGQGRTLGDELFLRALHWGAGKGVTHLYPPQYWAADTKQTKEGLVFVQPGRKLMKRWVERGVLGKHLSVQVDKIPPPIQEDQLAESATTPKKRHNRFRALFRRILRR